ncbi:glycosyltransferase [Kineococcus sp. NPDC059986]|uniref:glycosyltransferase n=1 Tax=Kineococcus sp. NPDC059986 TaxID=3155538 RepID=UPI0034501D64
MTRRPLRVLVTHPGASLYGSDRMVLEALRGMVSGEVDPVLATTGEGALVDAARRAGVPVLRCPVPVLRKSALSPRGLLGLAAASVAGVVRGARTIRRVRPDVVYVSTVTTPTWLLAARASRVPVVCHVHEAESSASWPVRRALSAPLLLAGSLLVNSTFAGDLLAASWPRLRARTWLVPNGVAGPPAGPGARRKGGGPARLLYVGRLSERKGVLVALDAFDLLRATGVDVRLDLVGDVFAEHADFAERLRDRTRSLVASGHVVLHGFDEDVWTHLRACDVLIVPSLLPEPFGNVAVEGVLAGRPVVASDTGGLPEALAGYRSARLVPPGDAESLAAGLRGVLAELDELTAAAAEDALVAARRHAPQRYGEVLVQRVGDVLR